ncbi:DNA polymerase III subunit delta [Brackiella oedipodis]|uniref:DNA polymerase III subunit delta n=1 Tax=Brackiella oedipodis TaxID=124225 RepID=UPI000A95FA0C|nr:DNA polymerase III subunit delta [Brackiella oedipodis]
MAHLYVITGDELLLRNEQLDRLRADLRQQGFSTSFKYSMQATSHWDEILQESQNVSLFAESKILEVELSSGKPGRNGAEVLIQLSEQMAKNALPDVALIVLLPKLDRATQTSKWAKALFDKAKVFTLPVITAQQLPQWIEQRLQQQKQSVDRATLQWIVDQVEGNLLAAQQEILKLGLAFGEGPIAWQDIEASIQDVARYNVFALSEAMLKAQAARSSKILRGLQAEGEQLPMVLGFMLRDIRDLYALAQAREQHSLNASTFKQLRIFGPREHHLKQALNRLSFRQLQGILQHAHDIDRGFKGFPAKHRLSDQWQELNKLALRIAAP